MQLVGTGEGPYTVRAYAAETSTGGSMATITGTAHVGATESRGLGFGPPLTLHFGAACVADVDDGSGSGNPDGGVGIEDLLYYLGRYNAGTAQADVDNGSGTGTPDGGVGIEDLLYYLVRYNAGC